MPNDFGSLGVNFRAKYLEKRYLYLGLNLVVVTWSLYDDVTTKHFVGKILNFRVNKKFKLAL